MKDANLEQRPMNLKEGDRYIVNHDEGLTTIDFDGGDAATAWAIDRSEGKREKRCGRRLAVLSTERPEQQRLQEGRRKRAGVEVIVCCSWGRERVAARWS
ncbi:hypothetical protein BHE74_00051589 [Ensete ventricosum]|nr:hypothetical protein BHE74_00051589 [Ensete ventricosum]